MMPRKSPYKAKKQPSEQVTLRILRQKLALKRDQFRFRHEENETTLAAAERDIARQRKKQRVNAMNDILRKHGREEIPG